MIIIGEKLNSSIPSAERLMRERDGAKLAALALRQAEGGAQYLDLNTAMFMEKEAEVMRWAIAQMENAGLPPEVGFALDSPNPAALREVLPDCKGRPLLINSLSLEKKRFDGMLELVTLYGTAIVALPIDNDGVPEEADRRVANAERLVEALRGAGIPDERIYVDALVHALAAQYESGAVLLETIRRLRGRFQDIHIVCGIGNASFGLPERHAVTCALLSAAIAAGLDCAITDILSRDIRLTIAAAELILGRDEYCMNYIETFKALE